MSQPSAASVPAWKQSPKSRDRGSLLQSARVGGVRGLALVSLVCAATLFPGSPEAATTVYRSVDADGNVTFTDQPPTPGEEAEAVEIREPASFSAPAPVATDEETWSAEGEAGEDFDQAPFVYTGLAIVAPAADEGVRENAGNVTVIAAVEPELQPGHEIEVLLDGEAIAGAAGTSVVLTDIERGSHTLEARIVDESGAILISSAPSTFHMLRYVQQLAPNRPKPTPHGN